MDSLPEVRFTRIKEQWDQLKTMYPKTETEDAAAAAMDLEAEIRQAQIQLAQLKKQRELIEIQQRVAEERRELELARDKLQAITNSVHVSPATPAVTPIVTPSRDDPRTNARAEVPQKKQCIARTVPTAPSNNRTDHRSSSYPSQSTPLQASPLQATTAQLKPCEVKSSPLPPNTSNSTSKPSLDELRALAAASLRPAGDLAAQNGESANAGSHQPGSSEQSSAKPSNPSTQPAAASKAPPAPNMPLYLGRALGEFKNFAIGLDRHFDKYRDWYQDEEHKVSRALKHVTHGIEDEWKRELRDEPSTKITYANFCFFLIGQLQKGINPQAAKGRYYDSYQRPSQSVTDFSNWMQQWPPNFPNKETERDRMRHLFEHLMNRIRNEASKTHLDFDNYSDFVNYLQGVEDSIESRGDSLGRGVNPRKRPRGD